MEKHLNEREEQRIEELSSHGPPPAPSRDGDAAPSNQKSATAAAESTRKSSMLLPLKSEVAQKLHRAALLAATVEVEPYAPGSWQIRNEIAQGYEAFLALCQAGAEGSKPAVTIILTCVFDSKSDDATSVQSIYTFESEVATSSELADEVFNKTNTVFETTLR